MLLLEIRQQSLKIYNLTDGVTDIIHMNIKQRIQSPLLKGILYMGMGTIIAQMINVLIQPILTRIVPADTLGIYTYVVSMANIVIPISSLKLEMLIVSEENDNEAQYITDLCKYIVFITSILFLIVLLLGYNIPMFTVFNKYGAIVFLAPLLALTNGLRFLFISYNNRYKNYKLITGVAIIREAVRAIIQVVSGLLTFGVFGQLLGYAFSPIIGLKIQAKEYLSQKKNRNKITYLKAKNILNKGKGQILYLVPGQFINSFSASFVTISITALFSATVLGHYSTGVRLLDIPILFITSNVNKVCYQRFSEDVINKRPLRKTLFSLIFVLCIISFSGFGILFLVAPRLSDFIFGDGYYIAGVYIKHLCVMYAVRLVATSFNGIFTIFKKQKYELILNIALIAVAILAYVLAVMFKMSIIGYLNVICIGYTAVYCCLLIGYCMICLSYDKSLCSK